jgi:WD40 repeat protein
LNNTLGVVLKNLSLSIFGVSSIQEMSDSTFVVSDFNKKIHIINPNSGKIIRIYDLNTSISSSISLKLLNDGNLAVSYANEVRILNATSGTLLRVLKGQREWVSCMELLKNGLLAVGSDDRSIKIWNTTIGTLIRTFSGLTSSVINFLKVLDNGSLASSSGNVEINIWNPNTGELIGRINEMDYVYSMESLKNGLLAIGTVKKIKIWNISNGKLVSVFNDYRSYKEDDAYAVLRYTEVKYIKYKGRK